MRIDGAGTPNLPIVPAAAPRAAAAPPAANPTAASASNAATLSAAALALQQQEQKGGGGGGGGHGGGHAKKALDSIDDIAARNSLNIEQRKKTMLDRQNDIERLKAELAAADEEVGEKDGEPAGEERENADTGNADTDEQPA